MLYFRKGTVKFHSDQRGFLRLVDNVMSANRTRQLGVNNMDEFMELNFRNDPAVCRVRRSMDNIRKEAEEAMGSPRYGDFQQKGRVLRLMLAGRARPEISPLPPLDKRDEEAYLRHYQKCEKERADTLEAIDEAEEERQIAEDYDGQQDNDEMWNNGGLNDDKGGEDEDSEEVDEPPKKKGKM